MKSQGHIQKRILFSIVGLFLAAASLSAQTFNVLHNFSKYPVYQTNSDGGRPQGSLTLSNNILYGVASEGGTNDYGLIFSIGTDGSDYTVIHNFAGTSAFYDNGGIESVKNVEGAEPTVTPILCGNILYGANKTGGTNGYGTLYSVATDGTGFTVLHTFGTSGDGSYPESLVLSSNRVLYGVTANYGIAGTRSVIFSINTNGTGFNVLYSGMDLPEGNLLLAGNVLYGATRYDGTGYGTIYSYDIGGRSFKTLYSFSELLPTNTDGAFPSCSLVNGSTIYGTTSMGGTNNNGVVFSINTNGLNFQNIYTFSPVPSGSKTNLDGITPSAFLVLNGDTLYGTTAQYGPEGGGTIFSVNTNGANFSTLYGFAGYPVGTNSSGANPGGMVLCGKTFYGIASDGGNGYGTVFSLGFVPFISSFCFAGSNLTLNVEGGMAGESCSVLATGNLSMPLSQWTPITTCMLTNTGCCTVTVSNTATPAASQGFYTVKVQ